MSLSEYAFQYEREIRLGFFFGVFFIMASWEFFGARRKLLIAKPKRWISNLGILLIDIVTLRILFPAAAVGISLYAAEQGWGLFNIYSVPLLVSIVISVLILDFVIYLQHVAVHKVELLWRLHRVHHADLDFDVTTGLRFHPLEIVFSMLVKAVAIVLLGPPAVAVLVFEVILNATAMFNHSNVRIPLRVDQVLRYFVVTPDMHRVHHSVERDETDSNFGFNVPWWDRIFGTYRAQPRAGHLDMTIGLAEFRDPNVADRLDGLILMPFFRRK